MPLCHRLTESLRAAGQNVTLEALGTSNDPGERRAGIPVGQVNRVVFAQQVGTSPLYWLIGMQAIFSPTAWR